MTSGRVSAGHVDGDTATDRPARIAAARAAADRVSVHPPAGFPAERVPALAAVAGHHTVHNSLEHPPEVTATVG